MNKNAIKKFAIEARKKLIDSVTDKAGMLGITEKSCSEPITKGTDFEVYQTVAGTEVTLNKRQCEQRRRLVSQIESRGFEEVVEEVAYTWFNRICAIRFMEVNDYLPNRVRVLSSEKKGKMEPDLVTQAPDVDLDLSVQEKEEIINWKMSGTSVDTDKLYCKLFLKQCHQLHDILPGLFEADFDYMELLFGISYTNKDDVIYMLVNSETGIPEDDFNVSTLDEEGNPTGQVEIIGWLYQYYNTELKDDTFAKLKKNVKITKEKIPAATQLFTPDWIVRYMVENSVGRIWIEHLRAVDSSTDEKETAERFGWKYYLPEAEQEDSVNVKLATIRTTYKDLKPTDITCIDPCMGSGHILIAMFDVLMDIYESAGYDKREAVFEIVEHNIHGLDIDQRAYQLAYFAVMIKARTYNRRYFYGIQERNITTNIFCIAESNNINSKHVEYLIRHNPEMGEVSENIKELLHSLLDATEYGSLVNVPMLDWERIEKILSVNVKIEQISFETLGIEETKRKLKNLISVGKLLAGQYLVVSTNPPYKGKSDLNKKLAEYIESYYVAGKKDIYAAFMIRNNYFCKNEGILAMITQQSWMFEDYEKLRDEYINNELINCIHLGAHAFDEINGEIVKTVSFCLRKNYISNYKTVFIDDTLAVGEKEKALSYLKKRGIYYAKCEKFKFIPQRIFAYWLSDSAIAVFKEFSPIKNILNPKQGTSTGNDEKFVKYWYEIDYSLFKKNAISIEDALNSGYKYFPLDKGGEYRKWYGNNEKVIMFDRLSYNELLQIGNHLPSRNLYFKEGITWSKIASNISVRYDSDGFVFSSVGLKGFPTIDYRQVLGYMNSSVCRYFSKVLSPGISIVSGDIEKLPFRELQEPSKLIKLVQECIDICRSDWDERETSWDFKIHPYVQIYRNNPGITVSEVADRYSEYKRNQMDLLYNHEKIINEIFIEDYGLQDEVSSEIEEKDNSIKMRNQDEMVKSLLSYIVGCIFGRYSIKQKSIYIAGDKFEKTFEDYMDEDNIIPITQEEYFEDDIVNNICDMIRIIFGENNYEDNLLYISSRLKGASGNAREILRNYFMKDFYKDHCAMYNKLPIYWMFSSGKENAFKALVYIHRMNENTVKQLRTEYLHKTQNAIESVLKSLEYELEAYEKVSGKAIKTKQINRYKKQLSEIRQYDEAIAHIANNEKKIQLERGIKENYKNYQGVQVKKEGQRTLDIDLLERI